MYAGHLMMENRNALIVDATSTPADGYAERQAAVETLDRLPKTKRRRTIAADKAYDTADFVADVRQRGSHPMSPRTPPGAGHGSMAPRPAMAATASPSGSEPGSRNRADRSRPSAAVTNSATRAETATAPGSR